MSNLLYVGLDVHQRTSTCHILDAHGRTLNKLCRTIGGHWTKMIDYLRSLDRPIAVTYEASIGYGAIYDRLVGLAKRIVVAHPGRVRLIFQSKRKNDRIDAAKLAKLLFLDELPAVHVPDLDTRAWRELIEFRRRQIDQRTRIKCGLRAMLRQYAILKPRDVGGLWTKKGRAWLTQIDWPHEAPAFRAEVLLDQLMHIEITIDKVTDRLDRLAGEHPGVTLVQTIPGVGPRTAEALLAYIDDPHRFSQLDRIGAYFGLVPCQDASAARNHLGHITKQGPPTVRKFLTEAAWHLIRLCPRMKAMFDRVTGGKPDRRQDPAGYAWGVPYCKQSFGGHRCC